MLKQDDHFSYENCYQYGSFIKINEYVDKNLIVYETGIHYINMIKKKGSLIMNKTAYNHSKGWPPYKKKSPLSQLEIDSIDR